MGANIVIKGADFSQNAIEPSADELIVGIFNSQIAHHGLATSASSSIGNTNVAGVYYTDSYNGSKKICIGNGGIALSDFLDVLGVTKITFTPVNGYRFNVAIGNSEISIICDGSWAHLTQELTIDFKSFHGRDWTQVEDCVFLLCIVQRESASTETLEEDFGTYMYFTCQ